MKKILEIFISIVLIISLVSCSDVVKSNNEDLKKIEIETPTLTPTRMPISTPTIEPTPVLELQINKIEFDDKFELNNATLYSVDDGYVIDSGEVKYQVNREGLYERNDIYIGENTLLFNSPLIKNFPELSENLNYIVSTDDGIFEYSRDETGGGIGIEWFCSIYDSLHEDSLTYMSLLDGYSCADELMKAMGIREEYPFKEVGYLTTWAKAICENVTITIQKHEYGTAIFGGGYGFFVSHEGCKMLPPFLPELESDDELALYLMRTYDDIIAAYYFINKYNEDSNLVAKSIYDESRHLFDIYLVDEWEAHKYYQYVSGGKILPYKSYYNLTYGTICEDLFREDLFSFWSTLFVNDDGTRSRWPDKINTSFWYSAPDINERQEYRNFTVIKGFDVLFIFWLRNKNNYQAEINDVLKAYYLLYSASSNADIISSQMFYDYFIKNEFDFLQYKCIGKKIGLCVDYRSDLYIDTKYGKIKYNDFALSIDLLSDGYDMDTVETVKNHYIPIYPIKDSKGLDTSMLWEYIEVESE